MPFLTPKGRKALQDYKYRGGDLSLIYKYFSSPLAEASVKLLPTWVA